MQKQKANKVKLSMWNVSRKETFIVFELNGVHIEHMMPRLDAMDSSPNVLLDLFEDVEKHPLKRFRKRLTMDLSCPEALKALTEITFGAHKPLEIIQQRYRAVNI